MGTLTNVSSNVESPAISGRAYGGQAPIVGASVYVVTMGTGGYGSTGTVLTRTPAITDSGGNFTFARGVYTCPQSNTPVYLIALGGDAGSGYNAHIANAASLGTCANSLTSYVVVNEVTTTALAFSLAHFFTSTIGGFTQSNIDGDWFGGPSSTTGGVTTYSGGLTLGNTYTIPALVNTNSGRVALPSAGETIDSAKIYTIANILAACVNSSGSTSNNQPCGQLFKYTDFNNTIPYDTLQAAVVMALSDYSISGSGAGDNTAMTSLYALQGVTPAFDGGMTSQPNDFSIALSYTSSAFALGVDTGTASTIDIDANERVWFPSNLTGATGAGYFDQTSRTFNGPYSSTGMLHPQQVAIDQSGYAWLNDSQSFTVHGFLTTNPATTESFTLTGGFSSALTIAKDNSINVGIAYFGTNNEMAKISATRTTYTVQSGTSVTYPIISVTADVSGNSGVATTNTSSLQLTDYLISSSGTVTQEVNSNKDGSGQIIYTGNDFIGTRPFSQSNSGVSTKADGICIFSESHCYKIKGTTQNAPVGIAIDGAKSLWLPESLDAGVLQVTPTGTGGDPKGGVYLNSGGGVPNNEFLHDSANGGALLTPYGVAIDKEGNVWISNATCTFTGCLPTVTSPTFTLTEIIGVAAPTVTPVSGQVEFGLTGTEPIH
jgi:hypothetical protein